MSLDLEFRRFTCRLASPLETAHGPIEAREGFVVRISDGEHVGWGEATPLAEFTESLERCERALECAATAIEAGPDAAIEAVDQTAAARHAVSLAMVDLGAVRESQPLYQALGALERVARVPVNATIGDGTPAETARQAVRAVDAGFRCCKIKVGVRSVEADIERLQHVRKAVGKNVELRADANGAWTLPEASHALDAFASLDVAVLEQPLPAGALEGLATLCGTGVSIAVDEGLLEHGVDALAEADAADAVVLKPMALGGVDLASGIAAWVTELGWTPIVSTTIDAVVARTAAVHLAASIPDVPACGVATGPLLESDLGRDPVFFESGQAVVPQAKGLGVGDVWPE